MTPSIIAAARVVDGVGSLAPVETKVSELRGQGARLVELVIDPLAAGWDTPVAPNHFRSGCAPLEALAHARQLIDEGRADAVVIRGEDNLRTRYANDKAQRARLMAIYGEACPIPAAYTQLAQAFMRRHDLSPARFKELAELLFENYRRTALRRGEFVAPPPPAQRMVTELFRAIDCANPVVDFSGALLVGPASLADGKSVQILSVGLAQTTGDGPGFIDEIARYDHLREACRSAAAEAGIDLATQFRAGAALLDTYTCFPVVPLAFLLAAGIADTIDAIPALLAAHEITVTGGMNLARAPWNNPVLNALVVMCEQLTTGTVPLGAVHGNGGLGYRQGVAILRAG